MTSADVEGTSGWDEAEMIVSDGEGVCGATEERSAPENMPILICS